MTSEFFFLGAGRPRSHGSTPEKALALQYRLSVLFVQICSQLGPELGPSTEDDTSCGPHGYPVGSQGVSQCWLLWSAVGFPFCTQCEVTVDFDLFTNTSALLKFCEESDLGLLICSVRVHSNLVGDIWCNERPSCLWKGIPVEPSSERT